LQGLQGNRSSLVFQLTKVIATLQQKAPENTVGYILENVPAELNYKSQQVRQDAVQLDCMLGAHAVTDAVQHGSYAHRVRALWTNIVNIGLLQTAFRNQKPPPNREVDHILNEGRTAQKAMQSDRWPRCKVNTQGGILKALPTLMAHPYSYAYRSGKQGQVINTDGSTSQPTADERERALGYPQGATSAQGVNEEQIVAMLGRCMDAWCM
jgi:hypothetical protein